MDNLSEQMISTMSPDPYLYLTMQTNVCTAFHKSVLKSATCIVKEAILKSDVIDVKIT